MRFLGQHAARSQPLDQIPRRGVGRVDVHTGPQPAAAHVANQRTPGRHHVAQPGQQVLALRGAARHQVFVLDHLERFQGHGRGQGVAPEGGPVAAGIEHVHHAVVGQECADRQQSAAQCLAQDQRVRTDAFVLEGEPAPGAAQARLHFVDDEQHLIAAAPFAQLGEEARRRDDHPGFALDRFDQDRAGIGTRRRPHAGHVAEIEVRESRGERTEPGAILGLARESDDGGGAAVEVAARHQDFSLTIGDALDPVTPAPRALDRGFHRLRAGVHGQRALEAGQRAQLFQERAQRGAVVGARSDGHLFELALRRGHDAGMEMAVAHCGIRAHHVDVFAALDIPHQAIPRALHDHRHRPVVLRAEARFLGYERLGGAGAGMQFGGGAGVHDRVLRVESQSRTDSAAPGVNPGHARCGNGMNFGGSLPKRKWRRTAPNRCVSAGAPRFPAAESRRTP